VTGFVLQTERLELRPTAPEMFDAFWAAIEASLEELAPWMTWAVDPDPEHTRDFLIRASESWASGTDRPFTIFMAGRPCGQCSLDHVDALVRGCEIGYWMRSDVCGRGLMTEAAAAVVRYGFDEIGLHRIELHAGIENHASNRVATKLGFQKEGILRQAGLGAAGYYDINVYGLLTSDPRRTDRRA
jgi:ribosomal-protein-serine acetyltransferase